MKLLQMFCPGLPFPSLVALMFFSPLYAVADNSATKNEPCLHLWGTAEAPGSYWFVDIAAASDIVTETGDTLAYQIFLKGPHTSAAVDLEFDAYHYTLRDSGATDQSGRYAHPGYQDYTGLRDHWWSRQIELPEFLCFGYKVSAIKAAFAGNQGRGEVYIRNLKLLDYHQQVKWALNLGRPTYRFPAQSTSPGNHGYTETGMELCPSPEDAPGQLPSIAINPEMSSSAFDYCTKDPTCFWGINMYPYSAAFGIRYPASFYADLGLMGAGWNRFHFMALLGTNAMDWRSLDWAVKQHNRYPLNILGLINHETWVASTNFSNETFQAGFSDRFAEIVARYKQDIHHWEVWNEPDFPYGAFLPPETYGRILVQVYDRIKAGTNPIDPGATLILQVSNPWLGSGGGAEYLARVYSSTPVQEFRARRKGRQPWDAVSIHAYQWDRPTSRVLMKDHSINLESAIARGVRTIMNENGDSNKKIWITELGWNIATEGDDRMGPDHEENLRNQAAWLEEACFGLLSAQDPAHRELGPMIANLFYYCYEDPGRFGLRQEALMFRPAHRVYENISGTTAQVLLFSLAAADTSFDGPALTTGVDHHNDTYATDTGRHHASFHAMELQPLNLKGQIRRVFMGCEAHSQRLAPPDVGLSMQPFFGAKPGRMSGVLQTDETDQTFWREITLDARAPNGWTAETLKDLSVKVFVERPPVRENPGPFYLDEVFVKVIADCQ